MILLSSLKFMLPTQAAGAFVVDGTGLIILGALVAGYLAYKIIKDRTNVASTSQVHTTNDNTNLQTNTFEYKNYNQSKNDVKATQNVVNKNIEEDELVDYNNNQEFVLNRR